VDASELHIPATVRVGGAGDGTSSEDPASPGRVLTACAGRYFLDAEIWSTWLVRESGWMRCGNSWTGHPWWLSEGTT